MGAAYDGAFWEKLARQPLRHALRCAFFQTRLAAQAAKRRPAQIAAAARAGHAIHPVLEPLLAPAFRYQGYAGPWVEDYFLEYWLRNRPNPGPVYLPVLWSNFYQHAQLHEYTPTQFSRIQGSIRKLLDLELDRSKRYFTLLAYDHAIWDWHLFPRNVLVFSAGGWGDVPIPWLKGSPPFSCPPKDILLSFVGRIDGASDATGVRSRMYAALKDNALFAQGKDWRRIMRRSTFSLCPRGLGRATFRLYESLSVGSIPVNVWDDIEWLPYRDRIDWREISISVRIGDIARLPAMLREYPQQRIAAMQSRIGELYETYFSLEGVCSQVGRMAADLGQSPEFDSLIAQRQVSGE